MRGGRGGMVGYVRCVSVCRVRISMYMCIIFGLVRCACVCSVRIG